MRIDQVLPSLVGRDAIGAHTLNIKDALGAKGIECTIYYSTCTPDVADRGIHVIELPACREPRTVLYHASIGSPVFDLVTRLPDPIAIDYHNITPARLLERWEPSVAHELALGRRQLAELAPTCVLGLADSAYNERELIDLGYAPTAVAPLLIDVDPVDLVPDARLLSDLERRKAATGGPSLLYVGKISPHKAPHDLVAMVAAYRAEHGPGVSLTLVGSPLGDRYIEALRGFIDELGLSEAVQFAGSLSPAELEAHWSVADVFVTASDHEGFCVPLAEAMGHGVPIVAYGAAAVPDTVGEGGLVLTSKKPIPFATAVERVFSDESLRRQLTTAGRDNLARYDLEAATTSFIDTLLDGLVDEAS